MSNEEKGIVSNPIAEAVPTKISANELGQAMGQLDLSSVPPHRHKQAVMEHFFRVMADNVMDTKLANELKGSRVMRKGLILK